MKLNIGKKKSASVGEIEHEYYRPSRFMYDCIMRTKYHNMVTTKRKLVSTFKMQYGPMTFTDWRDGVKRNYYVRKDVWEDVSTPELVQRGYRKAEGLYDSIIFYGVPVYAKFETANVYDGSRIMEDGLPEISDDTSVTMNDYLKSNADEKFIKGMGKKAVSQMDMQKIGMVAMIGIAAVFAMFMMGLI